MNNQNKVYTGRRKESIARVRLKPGSGYIMINGKRINDFIGRIDHRNDIIQVLTDTNLEGKVNVIAKVNGGGITGQKDAIKLAVARAIEENYPELKHLLKEKGYLTRDPREKERRKYGLAKARKSYQFSKR